MFAFFLNFIFVLSKLFQYLLVICFTSEFLSNYSGQNKFEEQSFNHSTTFISNISMYLWRYLKVNGLLEQLLFCRYIVLKVFVTKRWLM